MVRELLDILVYVVLFSIPVLLLFLARFMERTAIDARVRQAQALRALRRIQESLEQDDHRKDD